MKKTFFLAILFLMLTGCRTYYCGVDTDLIKKASPKDLGWLAVGAVSSLVVHEAAHVAVCEMVGADYELKRCGLTTSYQDNLSDSEMRWIDRAGLLTQNGVGLFLGDSYFSKGFKFSSAAITLTYPLLHNGTGDLYNLDRHGGNASLEWGIYSILSVSNLFKVEW